MANVITFGYTAGGYQALEGDLRMSQMISREINLLLRDTANLRNSAFLAYQGSVNGLGTDTVRVRKAGLDGYDSFTTAANEVTAATVTDLTDGHADITVSRAYLMYQQTDLAALTSYGSMDVDPFRLAASMSGSYETYFSQLTCDAADSFGSNVGSNATQFSVDDFFSAIFQLEKAATMRGAPAPYALLIHSKALTELQDSMRNETGNALSYMPASAELLRAKGSGYAGSMLGVDIFKTSHVNANGSSGYNNFMMARNAIGFADGIPSTLAGSADFIRDGSKLIVEFARNPESAITKIIGHCYLGQAIIDDDKGVLVLSAQ